MLGACCGLPALIAFMIRGDLGDTPATCWSVWIMAILVGPMSGHGTCPPLSFFLFGLSSHTHMHIPALRDRRPWADLRVRVEPGQADAKTELLATQRQPVFLVRGFSPPPPPCFERKMTELIFQRLARTCRPWFRLAIIGTVLVLQVVVAVAVQRSDFTAGAEACILVSPEAIIPFYAFYVVLFMFILWKLYRVEDVFQLKFQFIAIFLLVPLFAGAWIILSFLQHDGKLPGTFFTPIFFCIGVALTSLVILYHPLILLTRELDIHVQSVPAQAQQQRIGRRKQRQRPVGNAYDQPRRGTFYFLFLYCFVLFSFVLFSFVLFDLVLFCFVLFCLVLF